MEKLNISQAAANYAINLAGYETANKLPMDFFSAPDHLAIKAVDVAQFESFVKSVTDIAEEAYCIEENPRFLVAAKLVGRVGVGPYGTVEWIEIKEPQPHKVGHDLVGLEHVEFLFSDFDFARYQLQRRNVQHEVRAEGNRHRISMVLRKEGHEVRLTDTPIWAIVAEKRENGEAYDLKAA